MKNDTNINIRIPSEILQATDNRAKDLGISTSEYIRIVLMMEMKTRFIEEMWSEELALLDKLLAVDLIKPKAIYGKIDINKFIRPYRGKSREA